MTNHERARQHVLHAEMTAIQEGYEIPNGDGNGYTFLVTFLAAEIVNLENDAKVLPAYDPDVFMDDPQPGKTYCDACGQSDACTCLDAEPDQLPTNEDNPHTISPVLVPSSAVHPLPFSRLDADAPVEGAVLIA